MVRNMLLLSVFIPLLALFPYVHPYCNEGIVCSECDLIRPLSSCNTFQRLPYYYCNNETNSVVYSSSKYFICGDNEMRLFDCAIEGAPAVFNQVTRECVQEETTDKEVEMTRERKKRAAAGSSRVGDVCAFNTDCQRGMYCGGGVCACLSDFVSINNHCWQKINPGESGCVEDRQCTAVWPSTICSQAGVCECPDDTVPSRTRDGTVCVSAHLPPSCPLPEPHSDTPNPATLLANPNTHPLQKDTYMPVLCTSTSSEVHNSNGGDGSTWCIYPDGDEDIYIADIYDCISHPQVSHTVFPEFSKSIDGVCCPNRAFTCMQPMESGPEPSVPRWWFNPATGTCVQFLWDPDTISGASANNFKTIEHCESYCRDTCKRGAAEYSSGKYALLDDQPLSNCLSGSQKCSPEHSCSMIGSQQTCCPTTNHVCSASGGRLYPSRPLDNYDRGVLIAGSKAQTRYYYDAELGKCVNFIFYGLGNFNNFVTKSDCEAFCSKLVCENGNPLRIGEEYQRCESNNDCPSSHTCQSSHKVCCPSSQTLCSQPKRLGDCTQSVRRYWYNSVTRQCEMFQFTGCQGNDNNFHSLMICQQKCKGVGVEPRCPHGRAFRSRDGVYQTCSDKGAQLCPANHNCFFDGTTHGCCPNKAFTCSLNSDKGVQCGSGEGNGGGKSFRYYFNSQKQSCETFQYEGCDGNSNNFLTSEECQSYCGVGGCPNGGMPLRDQSSNQQMSCSELKHCPNTHECIAIPNNGNVEHRCCPTKATICSQPPQQGNHCSKISVTKFYFNIVTKECASFQFNGCNGNLNNFATVIECNNFCSSAGCKVGEVAYKDVNSKKVYDCNNNLKNSCPADFHCRYNGLTSQYVCCGSTDMDVCPSDEKAFINPLDESIRECAINIPGSCPANFLCRFSPQRNKYYCCAPTTENVCPDGRALFRAPKTLLPQRCTLNTVNQCSDGYSCQSRSKDVLQGFCCSARNVCKGDAEFLTDDKTKMPRICTPGSFVTCPNGYRCHRSSKSSTNGFCCRGETTAHVTEGCPPGEFAYVKKAEIVSCDPFNIENRGCPATFTCQYAISFQRYQCCGKDPIEEEEIEQEESGCPAQQVAFTENDRALICTASGNNCPIGYFCQFSDKNRQFQCCGHKAGCPGLSVAFIDIMGGPMECNPAYSSCPEGYSCMKTKAGKTLCCTGSEKRIRKKDKKTTDDEFTNLMTSIEPKSTALTTTEAPEMEITTEAECPRDTVMSNGICKLRGSLGASCVTSSECQDGSECISHFCECSVGLAEKDGKCVKPRPECSEDEFDFDGECLKIGSLGDSCRIEQQCTNGTLCTDSRCRCAEGSVGYEGRCLANVCGVGRNAEVDRKGVLLHCAGQRCPSGSQCTYSKTIRNYICCRRKIYKQLNKKNSSQLTKSMGYTMTSRQPTNTRRPSNLPTLRASMSTSMSKKPKQTTSQGTSSWRTRTTVAFRTRTTVPIRTRTNPQTTRAAVATRRGTDGDRCPNGGIPLTFGANKMVWPCSPTRGCPKGYSCVGQKCCPTRRGKREVTVSCPRGFTRTESKINGERAVICQRQCRGNGDSMSCRVKRIVLQN